MIVRRGLAVESVATLDARLFWIRVRKVPGGCWEWTGKTHAQNPYGRMRVAGVIEYVHRIAWVMANGRPAPVDYSICHHCDNPRCVRPDHLYLGTNQSNTDDRKRRRRGGYGSFVPVEEAA